MFLVINSENIIVAAASYAINEDECATRGEYVIEIPDEEFTPTMLGALYHG